MVLTFRAGKFATFAVTAAAALAGLAACSREQQDWRSAEASDTVEAYAGFLKDHPNSDLVRQARAHLTQLSEDRAWNQAGSADTVDAYKQFLAQYPNGKWSQEARIRVENFELGAAGTGGSANGPGTSAIGASSVAAAPGGGNGAGVPASPAAGESAQVPAQPTSPQTSVASAQPAGQVAPGEVAQLPTSPTATQVQSPRPATYPAAAAAPFAAASGTVAPSGAAPTAAAAPAPSSLASAWRSADPTSYGVQLGAFASENAATGEWQLLVERFNAQLRGLAPQVVSAETATGRLFRLQALVADEATARALCDMLRKQSQACVPVLPH